VIEVPVSPEAGLADPELKVTWCDPPLHEAARTGAAISAVDAASTTAASPTTMQR
jgi:hypothetical protein